MRRIVIVSSRKLIAIREEAVSPGRLTLNGGKVSRGLGDDLGAQSCGQADENNQQNLA